MLAFFTHLKVRAIPPRFLIAKGSIVRLGRFALLRFFCFSFSFRFLIALRGTAVVAFLGHDPSVFGKW